MILPILRYPHPHLLKLAEAVNPRDETVRSLVADMFETMYAAKGVGLAAPQVDRLLRIVVMDTSTDRSRQWVLINPYIMCKSTQRVRMTEGCLSVPGVYEPVERGANVEVSFYDLDGVRHVEMFYDLEAICVQHELDHLVGVMFPDHLSPLKKNRIRKKMEKLK